MLCPLRSTPCLLVLLWLGSVFPALAADWTIGGGSGYTIVDTAVSAQVTGPSWYRLYYSRDGGSFLGPYALSTAVNSHPVVTSSAGMEEGEEITITRGHTYIFAICEFGYSYGSGSREVARTSPIDLTYTGTAQYLENSSDQTHYNLGSFSFSADATTGQVVEDLTGLNKGPIPEPIPVTDFFALGLDWEAVQATEAETISMLVEAASLEGSTLTKDSLISEIIALGGDPKISLEGVVLANGDRITFSAGEMTPVSGEVKNLGNGLIWTPDDVRLLGTQDLTSGEINYVTSQTDASGAVTVSTGRISSASASSSGVSTGGATAVSGGASAPITETEAGAVGAALSAEISDLSEADDFELDSMADQQATTKNAVEDLVGGLDFFSSSGGIPKYSSYAVSIPMPQGAVTADVDLSNPGVATIRAVLLFCLVLLVGSKAFKILDV